MKKITFLIDSLAGGGAENVCSNLANELAERNWEVNLVVMNMHQSVYHKILDSRVNLVVLDVPNARYSLVPLIRYLSVTKVDKVAVFNYELNIMLMLAKFFCSYNFKIIARNINTISKIQAMRSGLSYRSLANRVIKILYGKNNFIVNQSKGMRDDLLSIYKDIDHKTTVIYNPVRKEVAYAAKQLDFTNMKKSNYILCVGRLGRQKAFHYAIDAFNEIANDFPELRLKIIGKGETEGELKELVRKMGIQNRVDFEGFQQNVVDYYVDAKLVLLTSLFEGLPNVLIESVTLGTPVVSFDCESGPREIIENGVNGYLVNYIDKKNLKDMLFLALKEEWDYKCIHNTSVKFTADSIIQEWEDVFSTL